MTVQTVNQYRNPRTHRASRYREFAPFDMPNGNFERESNSPSASDIRTYVHAFSSFRRGAFAYTFARSFWRNSGSPKQCRSFCVKRSPSALVSSGLFRAIVLPQPVAGYQRELLQIRRHPLTEFSQNSRRNFPPPLSTVLTN